MAFSPGFLVTAHGHSGIFGARHPSLSAVPSARQAAGWWCARADACRRAETPVCRHARDRDPLRWPAAGTDPIRPRPPPCCHWSRSPTGKPGWPIAACCASRLPSRRRPMRVGSISTTGASGTTAVTTSRSPFTRLMSVSMLCATRSGSKAPVSAVLPEQCQRDNRHVIAAPRVMIGSSTPRPAGSQSAFEFGCLLQSYQRPPRCAQPQRIYRDHREAGREIDITCLERPKSAPAPARPGQRPSAPRPALPRGNGINTLAAGDGVILRLCSVV